MSVTARLMIDAVEAYNRFCNYIDAAHSAHIAGPYGSKRAAHIAESAKAAAKEHFTNFCTEFDNTRTAKDAKVAAEHAHVRFCTGMDAARSAYIKNRIIAWAMEQPGYDKVEADNLFEIVQKHISPAAHVAGCDAARAAGEEAWNAAYFTKFGGTAYDGAYIAKFCVVIAIIRKFTAKATKTYVQFCDYIDAAHVAGPYSYAAYVAESAKTTAKLFLTKYYVDLDKALDAESDYYALESAYDCFRDRIQGERNAYDCFHDGDDYIPYEAVEAIRIAAEKRDKVDRDWFVDWAMKKHGCEKREAEERFENAQYHTHYAAGKARAEAYETLEFEAAIKRVDARRLKFKTGHEHAFVKSEADAEHAFVKSEADAEREDAEREDAERVFDVPYWDDHDYEVNYDDEYDWSPP